MTTIRLELPITLNNGNEGRTKHWGAAATRRKKYEKIIRTKYGTKTPPKHKQAVTLIRVLGKGQRLYDPDSILRGNAKEIIDALTACGYWVDDSHKWLSSVDGRQDATMRHEGPMTIIEITSEVKA